MDGSGWRERGLTPEAGTGPGLPAFAPFETTGPVKLQNHHGVYEEDPHGFECARPMTLENQPVPAQSGTGKNGIPSERGPESPQPGIEHKFWIGFSHKNRGHRKRDVSRLLLRVTIPTHARLPLNRKDVLEETWGPSKVLSFERTGISAELDITPDTLLYKVPCAALYQGGTVSLTRFDSFLRAPTIPCAG